MNLEEFKKMIGESDVVFVDFYADWCGPCQMMMPAIEEIEKEFKDEKKLKIIKVNIDQNIEIAGEYNVMSVPTYIIFSKGERKDTMIGAQAKDQIVEKIKSLIK